MPISRTASLAHVLVNLDFDMVNKIAKAKIRTLLDDAATGDQEYTVSGPDFLALMGKPGVADVPLADQVTIATYEYLTDKGLLSGEIS